MPAIYEYMRFHKLILAASFLITSFSQAQTEFRNREFSITNENDVYLLLNNDKYYSNGVFLDYRFSPPSDTNTVKRVIGLGLAHRFWTPQDVTIANPELYWRPYAGLFSLRAESSGFYGENRRFMYGLEMGLMGKGSGAQAFQEGYHKLFGFPDPQGWDTQIASGFIIDFKLQYDYQFVLSPGLLDLISGTSVSVGNGFTNARQRLDMRIGKLRSLRYSSFFDALIGEGSDKVTTHNYFFLGYGIEVVGHNATIEGHAFGDDSPLTKSIVPWVRHLRLGFATNSETTGFRVVYNWLSEEVKGRAGRHAYISLELNLRMLPARSRL